jgi:hypothetical protein
MFARFEEERLRFIKRVQLVALVDCEWVLWTNWYNQGKADRYKGILLTTKPSKVRVERSLGRSTSPVLLPVGPGI